MKVQLTFTQGLICTIAAGVVCWCIDRFLLGGYVIPGLIGAVICGHKIGKISGG